MRGFIATSRQLQQEWPSNVQARCLMGSVISALVISRKQLGDFLLLQPAMEHLHSIEGCAIYCYTRSDYGALREIMPCRPKAYNQLTEEVFDRLYCFESGRSTSLLSGWIRSRRKTIGLTRPFLASWQRLVFDEVVERDASASYRGVVFHAMAGGDPTRFRPPALLAPPDTWLPRSLPERYLVIHPTSAWQRKTWDVSGWRKVIQELHRRTGLHLIITAGAAEWETAMADEIALGISLPILNFAGRTTLREYLAVLSRASVTLCIDGSASHLSAAFGRPTLTLFGPTNPVHWHWPTHTSRRLWAGDFASEQKPPVSAIPHLAVLDAALELLADASQAGDGHG
ncbi:MAG: glycosyltransferase family 9 protein [Pseudomonadota bacterium]